MPKREVQRLLLRVLELLYLDLHNYDRAWHGTMGDLGNVISINGEEGINILDPNRFPTGETGTLLWIQDDSGNDEEI